MSDCYDGLINAYCYLPQYYEVLSELSSSDVMRLIGIYVANRIQYFSSFKDSMHGVTSTKHCFIQISELISKFKSIDLSRFIQEVSSLKIINSCEFIRSEVNIMRGYLNLMRGIFERMRRLFDGFIYNEHIKGLFGDAKEILYLNWLLFVYNKKTILNRDNDYHRCFLLVLSVLDLVVDIVESYAYEKKSVFDGLENVFNCMREAIRKQATINGLNSNQIIGLKSRIMENLKDLKLDFQNESKENNQLQFTKDNQTKSYSFISILLANSNIKLIEYKYKDLTLQYELDDLYLFDLFTKNISLSLNRIGNTATKNPGSRALIRGRQQEIFNLGDINKNFCSGLNVMQFHLSDLFDSLFDFIQENSIEFIVSLTKSDHTSYFTHEALKDLKKKFEIFYCGLIGDLFYYQRENLLLDEEYFNSKINNRAFLANMMLISFYIYNRILIEEQYNIASSDKFTIQFITNVTKYRDYNLEEFDKIVRDLIKIEILRNDMTSKIKELEFLLVNFLIFGKDSNLGHCIYDFEKFQSRIYSQASDIILNIGLKLNVSYDTSAKALKMIKYFVGRLGLLKERFFGLYVFGCIYASIKISDYRVDLEHMIRHFRDEFIHISPGIFEFLSNGAIKCRSSFLRYYKRICHPLIKSYIKDLKQSDAQTIHRSNVLRDGNSDSAIGKDLRYFSIIQRHKYKTILQITESMTETQLIGKKRLIGTKT